VSALGDRWFATRAGLALVSAHARYWSSVAPLVRRQLHRWESRAAQIKDPSLQGLALGKLRDERFNVEVAAMVATIAPARYRDQTVEAIVALQIMYDYLDALTEQPVVDPIRHGLHYSKAFSDAVAISPVAIEDYYTFYQGSGDGGYLSDLARTVRRVLQRLPAVDATADVIRNSAKRCAEAQVRIHATTSSGIEQVENWARTEASETELQWREWLFGAMGSVVAAHALIAAAADEHTTHEQAREIDSLYLSLCVLTTALDHLVDHERDLATGEESYLSLYESPDELSQQIAIVTRRVMRRARSIPNGPHHAVMLAGVVAYYTSQPSATGDFARPVAEQAQAELRPLITPTLASMRAWRLAKQARLRR
jgi:tetraprenyl-beta-curcumene synthase